MINLTGNIDRLSALNTMASFLGVPPLTTIEEVVTEPDFRLADAILEEINVSVQSQGLPCNRDRDYPLEPDELTGEIAIPEGTLLVDPSDSQNNRYVERSGRIYDTQERTFTIDKPINMDIIWYQEFDSLPQVVRKYISISAARSLIARVKGEESLFSKTQSDEARALLEFKRYVSRVGDYNMLENPDVQPMVYRPSYGVY